MILYYGISYDTLAYCYPIKICRLLPFPKILPQRSLAHGCSFACFSLVVVSSQQKNSWEKKLSENNQVRVVISHFFKEHADFSIKNQQRVIKSMPIPGSDWRYLPYIRPIFQGISPENTAKHMVLTYLHFWILKNSARAVQLPNFHSASKLATAVQILWRSSCARKPKTRTASHEH